MMDAGALDSASSSGIEDSGDYETDLRTTINQMSARLRTDPRDVAALLLRGDAFFELGEADRAAADLTKALELEAHCASTNYYLARFKLAAGDSAAVLEHIQRAIYLDTVSPGHKVDVQTRYAEDSRGMAQYILASGLFDQGKSEEALKAIDRAIELDGEDGSFYLLRGEIKRAAGRSREAMADLDLAVEYEPEDAEVRLERALALTEEGDLGGALKDLERAFIIAEAGGEVSSELYAARAEIYAQRQDVLRAREDYRKAVEADSENIDAHLGLADIAIRNRDFETAERHLVKAEEIDTAEPTVYLYRGVLARAREDFELARLCLDRAIKIEPEYAEAYFLRGQVRKELGDPGADADQRQARELGYDPAP